MQNNELTRISDILYWLLAILISLLYVNGFFWHDDGRILFQVVENMYQGLGPVYTAGDRVQVYSSPLWGYYLLFFRCLTSNFNAIILLASVVPLWSIITWFRIKHRDYSFVLLAVLFSSNVLFSYWGNGLDNPLTYALLTLLIYSFSSEKTKLFVFISALLLLNRLDSVVYIAPLSILFLRQHSLKQNLSNFFKFGWPFYIYLLFSLVYYGSIFPNAYYSKVVSVDISMAERLIVFVRYILPTIKNSPLDILFLLSPLMLFLVYRKELGSRKFKTTLSLAAFATTLFYVFWVGCDHMNPRFLGTPMFLALLISFEFFAPVVYKDIKAVKNGLIIPAILTSIVLLMVANYSTYFPVNKLKFMEGKELEKNPTFHHNFIYSQEFYMYDGQLQGSVVRVLRNEQDDRLVRPDNGEHMVGFIGDAGTVLEMGYNIHNIDYMGITDPIMARIKTIQEHYAPGHNYRPVPRGYPETLMEGTNKIVHPEIAAYYDRLKNVISGDLFTLSRFMDIIYLNTHMLIIDPNELDNSKYFLSHKDYDQILEEDYGICMQVDEFTAYCPNGEKSIGFTTKYWQGDDLLTEVGSPIDSVNNAAGLRTSVPDQKLRPGQYTFEVDYIGSGGGGDQPIGKWEAAMMIGEYPIALGKGDLPGTVGEPAKISGTFTVERQQDMAKFALQTFANDSSNLNIKGIRLTKIEE